MTPDKINRAIAEACGWTVIRKGCSDKIGNFWGGYSPTDPHNWVPIPNYYNDLNAIHEAEGTLTNEQLEVYCNILHKPNHGVYWAIHATATQRAEAFLRALGKWEDGE